MATIDDGGVIDAVALTLLGLSETSLKGLDMILSVPLDSAIVLAVASGRPLPRQELILVGLKKPLKHRRPDHTA
ncbi:MULTISPECIES: hypothetical protein [unclassified Vibrio]|uniref:Uncharacterized protein n=1 Tax=Vibrio sp. HB236076 TaxID=3232307 RepID=A0AB39HGZ5_9VIBR|nr:hypothetical protein [Vibrio sp. HB161653]MDP5252976.1 hypothetical protein [Vibrio sp. HB161653]